MKTSFELVAELRDAQGKSASRRLRHTGKVPAILYGGHTEASQLALEHQKLLVLLDNEKFYSSIIAIKLGDKMQPAILKDLQRHPAKNVILHVDLQRVLDNEKIRMTIPLHFRGAAGAPGVKTEGGLVSHLRSDVEVQCLPKHLPEFLELDLSEMHVNDMKRLSDIQLPEGVELVDLTHGRDVAIVSIHHPRAEKEAPVAVAAAEAAPAAGAVAGGDAKKDDKAAAGAKPAAGGAKAAAVPAKKEGGKK